MIDFRDVVIIDKSQVYENLLQENKIIRKKNYLFLGLIVSSILILIISAYMEEKTNKSNS